MARAIGVWAHAFEEEGEVTTMIDESKPTTVRDGLTRKGEGADPLESNILCTCGTKYSPVAKEWNGNIMDGFAFLRWNYDQGKALPEPWFLQDILRADFIRFREVECPSCHSLATSIAARIYIVGPSADAGKKSE